MNQKTTILSLSGWAQKHTSLAPIFEDQDYEVINFDYSEFDDVESVFVSLKNLKINPKIIIGWSLGGQLAMRMIANQLFNPQLLISIGTPFQFVKSQGISAAMSQTAFDQFKNNFINSPDQTLKKFSILTIMNDKNADKLISNLEINDKNHHKLTFWLEELERFSCSDMDFSNFPKTLLIHGAGDMIVHVNQASIFADKIRNSKLEIFSNCGHAPHLNDLNKLRLMIKEEIISLPKIKRA